MLEHLQRVITLHIIWIHESGNCCGLCYILDLRRSKRKRVKPLEYWRGERIQYKVGADLCREVAGIDSGLPSRQWVGAVKRPGKMTFYITY
jgi:hypothetical protein